MSATRIETPNEISAAHWALSLKPPRSTNSVSSGRTANADDQPSELPTGSSTCLYMLTLPPSDSRMPESGGAKRSLARRLERVFADYGLVVSPSASCTAMVREHCRPDFAERLSALSGVWVTRL